MLGQSLVAELEATEAITALVGGSEPRIFPGNLPGPGTTLPAIRYEILSDLSHQATTGPVGRKRARVRLDAIATTVAAAVGIAVEIESLLDGFRGEMGGVFVHGSALEMGPIDGRYRPNDGSDVWWYVSRLDFVLVYRRV